MTSSLPYQQTMAPDVRVLVLETADSAIASAFRRVRPEDRINIDLVESTAEARTRVRQRSSTEAGYAALVIDAAYLQTERPAVERLIETNRANALVIVAGDPPGNLDVAERRVRIIDDVDSDRRLELLLQLVVSHAWVLEARNRCRETKSENRKLRDRLGLAEKRVRHLNRVFHHARDPVTGVANREFLVESLEIELEHHQRVLEYEFGFCILEIDNFEKHLEQRGRETLDKALVQMTSRVVETLRTSDRVARISQQKFGLILGDSPSASDLRTATTRLMDTLAAPMAVRGEAIDFSYSIGVTLSGPQHDTPDDIIQDANMAVAESKTSRGTEVTIYDQEYTADGIEGTVLAREMAEQLESREDSDFELSYQPILEVSERRTVGFEALCRWDHPERGNIEPNKFIAVAEQSNLILNLGLWTVEEVGRTLRRWRSFEDGPTIPFVTLNLSKEQIQSEEMATAVIETLKSYEVDPQRLVFELRETATIERHDAAVTNLGQLKSFGVRIAVDDFGVAHSSFDSLYRLPIDILKIDRSLVSRLGDARDRGRKIVRHLIDLCEDMDLTAIAEGVETEREHQALADLGCDYAQGYLYDTAMPSTRADQQAMTAADSGQIRAQ